MPGSASSPARRYFPIRNAGLASTRSSSTATVVPHNRGDEAVAERRQDLRIEAGAVQLDGTRLEVAAGRRQPVVRIRLQRLAVGGWSEVQIPARQPFPDGPRQAQRAFRLTVRLCRNRTRERRACEVPNHCVAAAGAYPLGETQTRAVCEPQSLAPEVECDKLPARTRFTRRTDGCGTPDVIGGALRGTRT
jgi:hypothetical protein